MRVCTAALLSILLGYAGNVHAHKSAAELASMCGSAVVEDQSRCLGYIQGYLEGAGSVNQQAAADMLDRAASESAWIRRAMETRVGTKLRAMGRDLAQPFCLSGDNPAAQLKARVKQEVSLQEGAAASAWLSSLVNDEFPCGQPI